MMAGTGWQNGGNIQVNILGKVERYQQGQSNVLYVEPEHSGQVARTPAGCQSTDIPGISSRRPINTQDMDTISEKLTEVDWTKLTAFLELPRSVVAQIDHDFHLEGLFEKIYQTLRKWKERETDVNATVGVIVKALVEIGRGDVARTLKP